MIKLYAAKELQEDQIWPTKITFYDDVMDVTKKEAKKELAEAAIETQEEAFEQRMHYAINFDRIFGAFKKPPLTMADLRRDCFPKEYQWYREQPESIEVEEHPARDWKGKLALIKKDLEGKENDTI
jgi:hypothetical protein